MRQPFHSTRELFFPCFNFAVPQKLKIFKNKYSYCCITNIRLDFFNKMSIIVNTLEGVKDQSNQFERASAQLPLGNQMFSISNASEQFISVKSGAQSDGRIYFLLINPFCMDYFSHLSSNAVESYHPSLSHMCSCKLHNRQRHAIVGL